ncbi:MAG: asparagine synthase (glutamine-hydrolyzing) [Candidatus Paceibacterota bacterium]|jgi:asparagine synthase (glutamine-hydrolysing)
MCGIIAISGKNSDALKNEKVLSMLATLSRRGPDDKGFDRFAGSVVGQTRLSIVDLSTGHQPMRDNARPHTIVFNGEIYGYKDLRADLESRGHRFGTASDTEVVLKAYAEYGEDCVKYIDGMFAFAIWDEEKGRLFVARDRFGKKPFYYTTVDSTFYAASEIKSLFATGLVRGEVDPAALDEYLRLMYVPPDRTVYSNIHTLPPAHAGLVEGGVLRSWRYWDLEKKPFTGTYAEAKAKVRELFDAAVAKRMVADVEVGALLSGGIDSTLVTLYAQRHSKSPIKTFSVGYDGGKSELPYALEASKKIGTDHYPLDVSADLSHELEEIVSYMDEPHGDSSNFPQHLISKLAATKVKVALSGDGADELFMGYGWYQKHAHTPRWKLSRWLGDDFSTYLKQITIFNERERKRLIKTPINPKAPFWKVIMDGIRDPLQKINIFDIKVYLPGQLLAKIDRTSMMHSLEIRSPFLDTALAEYVYNLPNEFKISRVEKRMLKEMLGEVFPTEFVHRRKQGFAAPVKDWLGQKTIKKLVEKLLRDDSRMYTFIARDEVLSILRRFYGGEIILAQKLWTLFCLALWFREHEKNHA